MYGNHVLSCSAGTHARTRTHTCLRAYQPRARAHTHTHTTAIPYTRYTRPPHGIVLCPIPSSCFRRVSRAHLFRTHSGTMCTTLRAAGFESCAPGAEFVQSVFTGDVTRRADLDDSAYIACAKEVAPRPSFFTHGFETDAVRSQQRLACLTDVECFQCVLLLQRPSVDADALAAAFPKIGVNVITAKHVAELSASVAVVRAAFSDAGLRMRLCSEAVM